MCSKERSPRPEKSIQCPATAYSCTINVQFSRTFTGVVVVEDSTVHSDPPAEELSLLVVGQERTQ